MALVYRVTGRVVFDKLARVRLATVVTLSHHGTPLLCLNSHDGTGSALRHRPRLSALAASSAASYSLVGLPARQRLLPAASGAWAMLIWQYSLRIGKGGWT